MNFFANISHEFRIPLTAIEILVNNISSGKFRESIDKKNKIFSEIKVNSHHLLNIINNFLDITEIEMGKFKLSNENILLVNFLGRCVAKMETIAENKGLRINFINNTKITQKQFGKLAVYADKTIFEIVVLNLISNAVKFTE